MKYTKLPLSTVDPLRVAYGLAWYERRPSSLSAAEWIQLDAAVVDGTIPSAEYFRWKGEERA